MVKEDVAEALDKSSLAGAEIIPVSSLTGEGIEQLKELLFKLISDTKGKNTEQPFRMPVDRVFTMQGFGTVATGTVIGGRVRVGEEISLYPAGTRLKVRNIQIHGEESKEAAAGQRAAINLQGVKNGDIVRGDTLAEKESMKPSMMADVLLRLLPDSPYSVKNGSRVHFYHGAAELMAKVVLLGGKEELCAGEECFAQLRFETPFVSRAGDGFVIRFYSPLITIGGGSILDPEAQKHKHSSLEAVKTLELLAKDDASSRLEAMLIENSLSFAPLSELRRRLSITKDELDAAAQSLLKNGRALALTEEIWLHQSSYAALCDKALSSLKAFHAAKALRAGMRREELRSQAFPYMPSAIADRLLSKMAEDGVFREQGRICALPDFHVSFSAREQATLETLRARYSASPYAPPERSLLQSEAQGDKELDGVLDYLLDEGELIAATPDIYFSRSAAESAFSVFCSLAEKEPVTLAAFRDSLETSRKYAMALLEYWDAAKLTKKTGDARLPVTRSS